MEKNIMSQRISNFVEGECKRFSRFAMAAVLALLVGGLFSPTFAQENGQQTFASAQEAANALFVAMQAPNEQAALSVLGATAKDVLSSGDPTQDGDVRAGFVVRYQTDASTDTGPRTRPAHLHPASDPRTRERLLRLLRARSKPLAHSVPA